MEPVSDEAAVSSAAQHDRNMMKQHSTSSFFHLHAGHGPPQPSEKQNLQHSQKIRKKLTSEVVFSKNKMQEASVDPWRCLDYVVFSMMSVISAAAAANQNEASDFSS